MLLPFFFMVPQDLKDKLFMCPGVQAIRFIDYPSVTLTNRFVAATIRFVAALIIIVARIRTAVVINMSI